MLESLWKWFVLAGWFSVNNNFSMMENGDYENKRKRGGVIFSWIFGIPLESLYLA
jgi:hypothetical protein